MISATLDRAAATQSLTTFSVAVVDGSGREVYGVPVTAHFYIGGRSYSVAGISGTDAETRFAGEFGDSDTVTLTAYGESLGPIRPRDGALLAIEA